MRFIGNKQSLLDEIKTFINSKVPDDHKMVLFDAFCGSGAVADGLKDKYDIIINDNLKWATVYTAGKIYGPACGFEKLGFDPFEFLNNSHDVRHDFIYKNYSPAMTNRMYFTPENAERIDYFRFQIEKWYKDHRINEKEYTYLLACLIESVSRVSNTAGVYGAFLKTWDARALKAIEFIKADCCETTGSSLQIFNDKIEDIVGDVNCDILYMDPPYTQNQYGTQYHLLETLVLNDNPSVSKVTGSRPVTPMRSDWSKEYKANILFDKILARTKAKYIFLSYNNDGFMSKEFIEASMKRYGVSGTYCCKTISYKKYQNWKSNNTREHFEYIFFVEKKPAEQVIYESPLNYIGSKSKVVSEIRHNLPKNIDCFVDALAGGFNVGINIDCPKIVYNEYNYFVKDLIESFVQYDTYEYIRYMKKEIERFGLEPAAKDEYLSARKYYNSLPRDNRDPRLLLVLILYGFQQQIRFNGNHDFNNPVGMRWFNDKILEKLISFSRAIKEKNVHFDCKDYVELLVQRDLKNDFFYLDPPYMLTTGAYNDGKRGFNGWNKDLEKEMFATLNLINENGGRFMLSYVIEHKGKQNAELLKWIGENHYRIIDFDAIIGISGSRRKEVLIVNYDEAYICN